VPGMATSNRAGANSLYEVIVSIDFCSFGRDLYKPILVGGAIGAGNVNGGWMEKLFLFKAACVVIA